MNASATRGPTSLLRARLTSAFGNSSPSPHLRIICMRFTPLPKANLLPLFCPLSKSLNSPDYGIFFNRNRRRTRLRLDDSTCAPLLAGAMTIMDVEISQGGRKFVSVTLNRKRTTLAVAVERKNGRTRFCAFSARAFSHRLDPLATLQSGMAAQRVRTMLRG